jgi:hypothetical protein
MLKVGLSRMRRVVLLLSASVAGVGFMVVTQAVPAGADVHNFTSTAVGQSGTTISFLEQIPWTLTWSYSSCSGAGSTGNFGVAVNQPSGDHAPDVGVNEVGSGGQGTDYYYDSGTFSLTVAGNCNWIISVDDDDAPTALGTPATYTSTETGQTSNPQEFSVSSPWTMAWSYGPCDRGPGDFSVDINQPAEDSTVNTGPNVLGSGGTGTNAYSDAGTFSFEVHSNCQWTITINQGTTPVQTPAPMPPNAVGMASSPDGEGYWIAYSNGAVNLHGDAFDVTNTLDTTQLNAPITHIVAGPDGPNGSSPASGNGYWLVAADGGIFNYGTAPFYGSMGGQRLNAAVVDMAPTPGGGGYWLVAADGGVFSFGNAQFHGSTGSLHLNKPIVGMAVDQTTGGYWLVASDGGIFAFDAPFYGSTGGISLNKPVNGMAATPDGEGYWMVASDGGIFNYGDAGFYGSAGSLHLNAPVVGMAPTAPGTGYWLVASDGGIFSYDAPFYGAH